MIRTHQSLAPAFVGGLAALAGLGVALAAHMTRFATNWPGIRDLLALPWTEWLGMKVAFWHGLAIQGSCEPCNSTVPD